MDIIKISLTDLSREKTIRSDTKFHLFYTNHVRNSREKFIPLTKVINIHRPKVNLSSINLTAIHYVEISNVTSEGEINPMSLAELKNVAKIERLTKKK